MDTLAFISRYEAILKEKKILKMQFYKDCGITDAAVSQWRTKKTKPAMKTISRIADYLGVSVGYLLGSDPKEKSPTPEGVGLPFETVLSLLDKLSDDELIDVLAKCTEAMRKKGER